ncbi:hypothetical protein [Desertibacillus haloalkaliphilus]|uniref:hypothetical protein n=1 Tax=Desertibacillus haloalkaliphilus TaxID=1328930 RepID=UPI001C2769B5|nr:hypothetical protein [Desertibacillus haloalkaliphilus]MBU8908472.1 hypothetical protein [Desertibacillus haloalkaliphilus]
MMRELFYKAGDIITCPTCNEESIQFVQNGYKNDRLTHDMVINHQSKTPFTEFDDCKCEHCESKDIWYVIMRG